MAAEPLSPMDFIAPARIKAQLLPVGRIRRSRFLAFVDLLRQQSLVRLGDVSPDPRPDRNMFSPLAFPNGTLLYDLSTSLPSASQSSLSPFEQFREPLLVIGIADATEYPWLDGSRADGDNSTVEPAADEDAQELISAARDLREQFPKAYHHCVMAFESVSQSRHPRLPQDTLLVPPMARLKTTTLKTIMCDLTSTLLAEMTTLARSMQALPTITSPASHSGSADNAPSWASPESGTAQFSRRASQTPTASRPESPVSGAQPKDLHRMSMPVLPSSSGGPLSTDDSRAGSPSTQGTRTPPTTFDEISGVNAPTSPPRNNTTSTKSARDTSADRVSIQGFGSGGVRERARNKGRGRVSIVIGSLYMCAGHWHEAIRELTDGATRARAYSDHLWQAKALENITVCLLLFAWSGMDFQIPQICFPIYDKSSSSKSPDHTPSNSVSDMSAPGRSSSHGVALESLNHLLPDLVNMILNMYSRAANFTGEAMPPLALSECVIRFSKLLAAMNLSAGYLDYDALQHLVRNTPYVQKPRLSVPRLSVHPTRNDIATMLFRALPGPVETSVMNSTDRVLVLAGVASVLSSLGLQRKKAIVMKEFITSLIPGLVQARKIGAAEMGVHPAAGLAALNMVGGHPSGAGALNLGEAEVENGIEEFLGLLGRIYGIPNSKGSFFDAPASGTLDSSHDATSQRLIDHILKISTLKSFGSLSLKLEVLRMCLNFCEALPDFNGVLHFTALLLRVAGPGTAPRPNSTDVVVSLPREEQVRLFSNISRTVAAANKLGLQHMETEYWDDFLLRGLFILEEPVPLRLTQHRPAELQLAKSEKDGPFLHNPWLKKPQTGASETILVANEDYRFVLALQNPYDFELEVQSLRIAADDIEFVGKEEHFLLGPYRTQKFQITGKALSSGSMKIIGCYIKVIGCRERLFPIFPQPWRPTRESKMKRIGLKACLGAPASRPSTAVDPTIARKAPSAPQPETLTFSVIPDQPVIVVSKVSLPQSALMVLEGERKLFTVTVKNTSATTAVDFVHITFQDSATTAMQSALTEKGLPAAELHELETQLARFPSLRWCKNDEEESFNIAPSTEAEFTVEVIGRTRLTDAVIQINYAHLGKRRSEVQDRFFTRQVSVPISITVNASVQLQRPDVVPLSDDFAWSNRNEQSTQSITTSPSAALLDKNSSHYQNFFQHMRTLGHGDEYCLLLLDLRNSWPNPLTTTLQVRPPPSLPADNNYSDDWDNAYTVTEVIQPGHVHRIAIVLPRIYIADPHAAVPSLNPASQRQFVVSTSNTSPETERASREAFWYRHSLLQFVRGAWKEGSGRHGDIELRSIRFSSRMVEAIKLDDLEIEASLSSDFAKGGESESGQMKQLGRRKFSVRVDSFLTLKTRVKNRSPNPISTVLRLQPYLAGLPHNLALDLDKRLSWTGVLQVKLPVIPPGEAVESELGVVALCSGIFEVGATVDEAEMIKVEGGEGEGGEKGGRPRSNTQMLLRGGDVLGEPKLRSWHLREPCTIVARRGDE
ncbi:Trs120-domain-containing protein [Macroventuria anomochaeta]|uniref:Trs120-domain-containing protein n=1 Tax=Macroventuria anomochaeta TaxID=301207 RepID=A0ACB6SH64_9PLEO|nr:Trs120-domain-containing protein [Macroventuria anomochaeta]KAF2633364.1 Trs120-domain-containing protein [Macroventuria anomochaeta]